MSSSRGCGNCGKLGRSLRVFQARWERWKTCSSFSTVPTRGSFHSLWSKNHFLQGCGKKLGLHFSSNEFFAKRAWYSLRFGGVISDHPAPANGGATDNSVFVRQLRGPLQDVAVMKQPIEHGVDRRGIT